MENKSNIVVLGAGKSGLGASLLAKKNGANVLVSDSSPISNYCKTFFDNSEILWEQNGHSEKKILSADLIIKSPGIPDSNRLIKKIEKKGIPIISEIEYAGRFCSGKKICVTGSNGKTTTTLMIENILNNAGLSTKAVGNIGESFALSVATNPVDYYVIELSSFQLDRMYEFKADLALILNITPDHLDRYENRFDNYFNSKLRVVQNMVSGDHLIFNYDDIEIRRRVSSIRSNFTKHPISIKEKLNEGAFLEDKRIQFNINHQKQTIMSIHQLAQQGKHNVFNSMAAGVAARVLDIRKEIIRDSLSDFQNIEHRLEHVAKIHGINFINDSKATNINSTWYALESMQRPTIWIVGGVDKGNDYSALEGLVKQKVLGIVCLGKDNKKIKDAYGEIIDQLYEAKTAEQAVQISYRIAKKGYNVLLSPACASFDLFKNFEDRGHQFKKAVRSL